MKPSLPIPSPLRGAEPDSFAHRTIVQRLPRIARRVLQENDFAPEAVDRMEVLLAEIPGAHIRPLQDIDTDASTVASATSWAAYVAPHLHKNWLEVPWFFAETYFYRRILEATGYFQEGPGFKVDPFAPHKAQSLEESLQQGRGLARRVAQWRDAGRAPEAGRQALSVALWGNQGDLSMWPAGEGEMPSHDDDAAAQAHVLVDDTEAVLGLLGQAADGPLRVDFLMDNVGLELLGDLALVDFLLAAGPGTTVVLHVKSHPTFVSDATAGDVRRMVSRLLQDEDGAMQTWATRLQDALDAGQIQLRHHDFWTSPLPGWKMPPDVRQTLGAAHLVVSKGDANYRRLLGDRHWAFTTPFEQIVSYFPAPLLALRTLKSEVAAGFAPAQVAQLDENSPGWTTSGQWGIIQFAS
jgi:hypothetical protein